MGVPPAVGMGAIRFSLGRSTTADEIDSVLAGFDAIAASPEARPNGRPDGPRT